MTELSNGGSPQRRTPRQPVARLRVLAAFMLAIIALFALGALTELLRHPAPSGPPSPQEEGGDPRDELACPEPEPREGREREEVDFDRIVRVDSGMLLDCPGTFDGSVVRYRGEVVGDVLNRRDGVWVQLNDDIYAGAAGPLPGHRTFEGGNSGIGVFIPLEMAEEITYVGGPAFHGDVLEIVGTFHRVDRISSEVAVIRATDGMVAQQGQPFEDRPLRKRQIAALILVPIALVVLVWERRSSRRF